MKQQDRIQLTIMAIGLSVLLIVRDVLGIELSKYIYLAYVVTFLAVAQYKTMVYMVCFILPLVCGLPGTYIMPCALALLIFKKKHVNIWQIGMLLFVTCAEILASFWYPTLKIPNMVQYISFAGVMFYLIHDKTELDHLQCVKMYMLGVSLLCAVIITTGVMNAPSGWQDLFIKGWFRFGETQMDELEGMKLTLNANSLAYYSVTGMCCGALLVEKVKGKDRILYLVLVFVSFAAGILTVSRSWLLILAICLFLYILSKAKYPKRFLAMAAVLALMLFAASWVVGSADEFITAFTTRLNDENMESGGERTELFAAYTTAFFNNIRVTLLGSGVTQYVDVLNMKQSMHNGTQQIVVCYGLLGFAVMLAALLKPIVGIRAKGKKDMICWLPLIGIILFVQTIQFLEPTMLMLPYIVGVFALKAGGTNDEKVHHNGRYRGR